MPVLKVVNIRMAFGLPSDDQYEFKTHSSSPQSHTGQRPVVLVPELAREWLDPVEPRERTELLGPHRATLYRALPSHYLENRRGGTKVYHNSCPCLLGGCRYRAKG